jgi:hypothetical protein
MIFTRNSLGVAKRSRDGIQSRFGELQRLQSRPRRRRNLHGGGG